MRNVYLYVDDLRWPSQEERPNGCVLVVVRNYDGAIEAINSFTKMGIPIFIDLDHDLGEEKSGYDIARYIVEHQIKNIEFRIHSMNPVGQYNIRQLMERYGYIEF